MCIAPLFRKLVLVSVLMLPMACNPGPRPIRYGEDVCAHCKMSVSDARYGAESITGTGKVLIFDSVECLASHTLQVQQEGGDVRSLWVTDFRHPGTLIPVEEAVFLHSARLRSPMGMNLTAFGHQIDRAGLQAEYGGELLAWDDVLTRVASDDPAGHETHAATPHRSMQP